MKADEILTVGAAHIASGWCKGSFSGWDSDQGGKTYCAMGALRLAGLGHAYSVPSPLRYDSDACGEYWTAEDALADVMREQFSIPERMSLLKEHIIAVVNDEYAKTKEEIIACMEKAAANLRSAP